MVFILFPGLIISQTMSEIKSAVSFIYVKDSLGKIIPNGTCFFMGIRSTIDSTGNYTYLITANHVLKKNDSTYYNEIFVRMNTSDSSSRFTWVPIYLNPPNKNVYLHSDSSVDIAVIPFVPLQKDYLFRYLDTTFLSDRNQYKSLPITEGTEVFFTGLFTSFIGEKQIYPIVRFGHVSLMTNEKIEWVGMKREMILIETSSFGGNSGSPVYFKLIDPNGYSKLILGGILNGTYRASGKIKFVETNRKVTPYAIYNNGISGITPVFFLQEILFNEGLSKLRR